MKAALLLNEVVQNVIEFDPESNYEAPNGCEIVVLGDSDQVSVGFVRDSLGNFTNPNAGQSPEPTEDQKKIANLQDAVDTLTMQLLSMGATP